MRIIAGEKKGSILKTPQGEATRPTLGRVRESVFGVLAQVIPGAHVLDLFAGSGSLGLEALSRGAAHCVFAETARPALEALRENIRKLGYEQRSAVDATDAIAAARKLQFSGGLTIIFSDPPYACGLAQQSLEALAQNPTLPDDSIIVIQCGAGDKITIPAGSRIREFRTKTYGETTIHFLESTSIAL